MKRYVITGGPSVGKTTVISILSSRNYVVVPESARIIAEQETKKKSGILPGKNVGHFQEKVALKQIELEKNIRGNDIVFLDRGLIDGYAYSVHHKTRIPEIIEMMSGNRYEKIFLLEPLETYVTDDIRLEDKSIALKLQEEIRKAYIRAGYEIISVPPLSPEARVDFILNNI